VPCIKTEKEKKESVSVNDILRGLKSTVSSSKGG